MKHSWTAENPVPERMHNRRLHRWEAFDKIELVLTPRYKTSGMSGDTWRTSVVVRFYFKGHQIYETAFLDMDHAIMLLAHDWVVQQETISGRVLEIEARTCDQPGCPNYATARYRIKRLASESGQWLDASEIYGNHCRKFCRVHLQRGDGAREDADSNYEPLDDLGPGDATNVQESPAHFGGVVEIGEPGDD